MKRLLAAFLPALLAMSACTAPVSPQEEMLRSMTLREKVAQLFVVDAVFPGIDSLVSTHGIGGVIFFSCTSDTLTARVQRLQSLGGKLPLLTTIDAERGLGMRVTDIERHPYASNMSSDSLAYSYGVLAGEQLRRFGVDVNFAPVADVNTNPSNPVIGRRAFGSTPSVVSQRALAYSRGLQSTGTVSCAKHFPGHGDTSTDSHKTLPVLKHSRERLDSIELYPFREMISGGVDMIMTAHLSVPALDSTLVPASISRPVVTGLLREEMGFDGIIVTDGLNMKGVSMLFESKAQPAVQAYIAGNDLLLLSEDPLGAIDIICEKILCGELTQEDLDNRVRRILKLKYKLYDSRLL